ncbi:hypothetical protein, partial [Helicobacter sp. MIT 05-5294]|uniref:hypothetical protein n=1 Tax=Helicobacter sp. MIT 05-5294 TaxID=1548150 RepID=UPI0010FEA5B3
MKREDNIYTSLNICQYKSNDNLPKNEKNLNDLGMAANAFLNIYLPANAAFVSIMSDMLEPKNHSVLLPNVPTIALGVNYGVVAYLFKKAEGKDNSRAASEAAIEFVISWQTSNIGKLIGEKIITSQVTKQIATRVATRLGIVMAGRILGGYVGSVVPIVGTIVCAVAGAWIAGKVEEWWFKEEDKQLANSKAQNETIDKLSQQYQDKINQIN